MSGWLSNAVQRTYDSRVGDAVVELGVRSRLKRLYSRYLYYRSDGDHAVEVGGTRATFRVTSPDVAFEVHQNVANEAPVIRSFQAAATPDDVFYDVGAGIGSFGCFVGQTAGHTVAFEPTEPRYGLLQENLDRNGIDCTTVQAALGEETGAREANEFVDADVVNGDELRADAGLPAPDLLKIDVDGPELHVVRGLAGTLQHSVRLVWIEVHPNRLRRRGHSIEDLESTLEGFGFQVERVSIRGLKSPFLEATR